MPGPADPPVDPESPLFESYLRLVAGLPDRGAHGHAAGLAHAGLLDEHGAVTSGVEVAEALLRTGACLEERAQRMRRAAARVDAALAHAAGTLWGEEIWDEATLRRCFVDLQREARHCVLAWDRRPHVTAPQDQAQSAGQVGALNRGVAYRVLYGQEILQRSELFQIMADSVACGEEARIAPRLPARLLLRDDVEALLVLPAEADGVVGLRVRQPRLVTVLRECFEVLWETALPIALDDPSSGETAAAHGRPSAPTLRLLTLLAAGNTDQAIARELGISTRTATRRVAALAAQLGARSRFQMGVLAARRGWL